MISTAEQNEPRRMIAPRTDEHSERCSQELADADKALAAFLKACEGLFGTVTAAHAAECWVGLAESAGSSEVVDPRHWRQITIEAASRMATRYGFSKLIACPDGTKQQ